MTTMIGSARRYALCAVQPRIRPSSNTSGDGSHAPFSLSNVERQGPRAAVRLASRKQSKARSKFPRLARASPMANSSWLRRSASSVPICSTWAAQADRANTASPSGVPSFIGRSRARLWKASA